MKISFVFKQLKVNIHLFDFEIKIGEWVVLGVEWIEIRYWVWESKHWINSQNQQLNIFFLICIPDKSGLSKVSRKENKQTDPEKEKPLRIAKAKAVAKLKKLELITNEGESHYRSFHEYRI